MRPAAQWAAVGALTALAVWWITDTPPATTVVPAVTSTDAVQTTVTTTTVLPTTTSTTVPATVETLPAALLQDARCPEWTSVNLYVGFPEAELATADRILWAESRCQLDQVNPTDANGGSWCAYQINRIHESRLLAEGIIGDWSELTTSQVACAAAAFDVWTRAGWSAWATY